MKTTKRSYEIAALSKGLLVLQALEGSSRTPITLKCVVERTQLNPNYCFRALKTLEVAGLVRETEHGYATTARLQNLTV